MGQKIYIHMCDDLKWFNALTQGRLILAQPGAQSACRGGGEEKVRDKPQKPVSKSEVDPSS